MGCQVKGGMAGMGWLESMSAAQTGLVVAFGAGLLIGVERERRKGQGPDRHSAGLRTFLVAALAGAAGQVLSPVVATVVLAAGALVLLPLLPAEPIAWLGHLSPRRVLMLVLVILLRQAASHLGQRLLGARAGVPMTGLLGGFVSSTATISALGSQARSGEVPLRLAWCGGVLSTAATWLQAWLIGGVLAPRHVSGVGGGGPGGGGGAGPVGAGPWR